MIPLETVVFDQLHACSYLPGRMARLPYRQPARMLTPEEFDRRLTAGDRRSGTLLYRPQCPACRACQPIRLDVAQFQPDATQRRIGRRGDALLEVQIHPPVIDDRRIELFNLHRRLRGLDTHDCLIDEDSYADFLTHTCCQTVELSYWHSDQLVAVAIADAGRTSLSAVYCYYDPHFKRLSLGTYSILRQVALCRSTGRRYLYLGLYIAQSPHMAYKARFRPHQRLIDGRWSPFTQTDDR
jgi:leucyl-tRNA---protein transferase